MGLDGALGPIPVENEAPGDGRSPLAGSDHNDLSPCAVGDRSRTLGSHRVRAVSPVVSRPPVPNKRHVLSGVQCAVALDLNIGEGDKEHLAILCRDSSVALLLFKPPYGPAAANTQQLGPADVQISCDRLMIAHAAGANTSFGANSVLAVSNRTPWDIAAFGSLAASALRTPAERPLVDHHRTGRVVAVFPDMSTADHPDGVPFVESPASEPDQDNDRRGEQRSGAG